MVSSAKLIQQYKTQQDEAERAHFAKIRRREHPAEGLPTFTAPTVRLQPLRARWRMIRHGDH